MKFNLSIDKIIFPEITSGFIFISIISLSILSQLNFFVESSIGNSKEISSLFMS